MGYSLFHCIGALVPYSQTRGDPRNRTEGVPGRELVEVGEVNTIPDPENPKQPNKNGKKFECYVTVIHVSVTSRR